MSILIVASNEPRTGRSLIAAALAYRAARAGRSVTLARLEGDESAAADATAFARIEGVSSPGRPMAASDLGSLAGDLVLEAPSGDASAFAKSAGARVITVATHDETPSAAAIYASVPAANVASVAGRADVLAVLPEDRVLAAPSVEDIAAAIEAQWLVRQGDPSGVERIMIGTVASDAASPYFGNRERKCVITRFDKTDIQLAALNTDLQCLVITGGGEPSPYLIDRVRGTRDDVAVLLAQRGTVDTFRQLEGTYGRSRFDGMGKLMRAVELLDAAGVPQDVFA